MASGRAILAYTMYYAMFFVKYFFKGTLKSQFLAFERKNSCTQDIINTFSEKNEGIFIKLSFISFFFPPHFIIYLKVVSKIMYCIPER